MHQIAYIAQKRVKLEEAVNLVIVPLLLSLESSLVSVPRIYHLPRDRNETAAFSKLGAMTAILIITAKKYKIAIMHIPG